VIVKLRERRGSVAHRGKCYCSDEAQHTSLHNHCGEDQIVSVHPEISRFQIWTQPETAWVILKLLHTDGWDHCFVLLEINEILFAIVVSYEHTHTHTLIQEEEESSTSYCPLESVMVCVCFRERDCIAELDCGFVKWDSLRMRDPVWKHGGGKQDTRRTRK